MIQILLSHTIAVAHIAFAHNEDINMHYKVTVKFSQNHYNIIYDNLNYGIPNIKMTTPISVSRSMDVNRINYHNSDRDNLHEEVNYIYCKLINVYFNFTIRDPKALKLAKSKLVLQKFTVCSVHPFP